MSPSDDYVTVAHHFGIRPIHARGLDGMAGKAFDNVAAPSSQEMHAARAGRAGRAIDLGQVFQATRFVTHKHTVNLSAQYSPLKIDTRG